MEIYLYFGKRQLNIAIYMIGIQIKCHQIVFQNKKLSQEQNKNTHKSTNVCQCFTYLVKLRKFLFIFSLNKIQNLLLVNYEYRILI